MADLISTISSTVVFLLAGTPLVPIGTAFIVGYPHPTIQNASIPIVVTAKHVLGGRDRVFGRFSTVEGKSTALVEYDLSKLKTSGDYWEHPDNGVDIAVFRTPHFKATQYAPLPLTIIASKEDFSSEGIQPTDRIIFPSLLVNFMGSERNYPVTRDGTIALIPEEKVPLRYQSGVSIVQTEQEVILVDAISIPGASGSPIFLWPGPRIKRNAFSIGGTRPLLLGVMHGFYPAVPRELIEIKTSDVRQMYAENSGIAIVFPSWRLREIFEQKNLKKRIDEIVSSSKAQSELILREFVKPCSNEPIQRTAY
ncbi:MAG: serine protease [Proteobacteria bacterium]|nr:serine protease [Pseudomonadota bacterium]